MIRPLIAGHQFESAEAIALQPDGRIVATACTLPSQNIPNLCVYRLEPKGTPDATFAGGSTVMTATKADWYSGSWHLARIAIQSTGHIVIATPCQATGASTRICVTRINANGTVDTSFGVNGQVTTLIGLSSVLGGLIVDSIDRIVVAASCISEATNNYHMCLARYSASSGALDASFGNNGTVIATFSPAPDHETSALGLAINREDGNLIVAGECLRPPAPGEMCVVRFGVNGGISASFGTAGISYVGVPGAEYSGAFAVTLQPDGKIVAGGKCPSGLICLIRLLPGGALDPTFDTAYGTSGISRLTFQGALDVSLRAMALQSDGRILVASRCLRSGEPYATFCLARLWPEGYADTSFGTGGYAMIDTTRSQDLNDIAIQTDGRIVAAGVCSGQSATAPHSCVLRVQGGPNTYSMCSFDIDGDGLIKPETDGLIMLRAMLGFSENRLLQGITVPARARRATSAAIRNFLVSQCGVVLRTN